MNHVPFYSAFGDVFSFEIVEVQNWLQSTPACVIAVAVACFWALYATTAWFTIWPPMKGPFPLPVIGSVWSTDIVQPHINSVVQHKKYGETFLFMLGHKPLISCDSRELLKQILVTDYLKFDRSPSEQIAFDDLLGGGLILQPNGPAKSARMALLKNFQPSALKASLLRPIQVGLQQVSKRLHKPGLDSTCAQFEAQSLMQEFTFEVAFRWLFHGHLDMSEDQIQEMRKCFDFALNHLHVRVFLPWIPKWAWEVLPTNSNKKYKRYICNLRENLGQAVLSVLQLESDGRSITSIPKGQDSNPSVVFNTHSKSGVLSSLVQQVIDEIHSESDGASQGSGANSCAPLSRVLDVSVKRLTTMLFASHDTTANTLAWSLFHIAKNEKIQEDLRSDIENNSFDGKFSKWILMESLRMYPSAPLRGRMITGACPVRMNDREIPPGTMCAFNLYSIHRDEKWWPDAWIFNPLRFNQSSPDFEHSISKNMQFVPFGAGPRKCLGEGMAMHVGQQLLEHIVRNYQLSLDVESPEPMDTVSITLRMAGEGVRLHARQLPT